ncbi:dihydroorotate dehydrogenase-like protein, partial [Novipirellula sp.]|uniref:dihydroorotate dehydrogenase-like protein n=1 Tax=Novipirellula sp. TaxID=2795430 RepID=UPI0035648389
MSIDLTTHFGGLKLESPILVGACPLTAEEQSHAAIAAAGAGAIVLPSLFQEQVLQWNQRRGLEVHEASPQLLERCKLGPTDTYCQSAESYLSMVQRAAAHVSIPIIASLNGECGGHWLDFAGELQQAGAAAIELNVHHPPPSEYASPREVEDALTELVTQIDAAITIPLFLKLDRYYTSPSHLAHRLLSGAQGLVLFGRAPDVDICLDSFQLKINWELTHAGSIVQSLGTIMRIHSYCPAMPLAACGGIGTPSDVIRVLLAGADVAMVTSAVYREGPGVIRTLVDGLRMFMDKHHIKSMRELEMQRPIEFSSGEQRQQYIKTLSRRREADEMLHQVHAVHGDRWGHPTL